MSETVWDTASRVVYPTQDEDLTLPLYVTAWTRPHIKDTAIDPRLALQNVDLAGMNRDGFEHLLNESLDAEGGGGELDGRVTIGSRTAIELHPGLHASMCTYFNAFPASYWKRWTNVTRVRFQARVQGAGEITVFKSTGRGLFSPVAILPCSASDGEYQTVEAVLPMTNLIDGGYFWFDAKAGADGELTIADATWSVPVSERTMATSSTLSIAITTFNRPTYCMNQLKAMAGEKALLPRLDTIYCVDQGDDLVRDQPDFAAVAAALGPKLTYLRQDNMGGSAGFSRGMFETLEAGASAYTLLLDDDAISEPESILRALQFADYTARPTIVGGGMLHLDNRTVLYAQGEDLEASKFWMKAPENRGYNHDFAKFPLRDARELHRRSDSDFNGWWMCLIPTSIMREIGLSLPVFIKFDDMEYALRARDHGYATVSLPGVAVWHQAWHDKDPGRTWEEYFTQRNRWIAALLHSPRPNPRFAYDMIYGDAELGLKFIYSGIKLRHMALQDVLRGPEYIVESMPAKMAEVRQARQGFHDTELAPSALDFPEPAHRFADRSRAASHAANGVTRVKALSQALATKHNGLDATVPDVAIPADKTIWQSYVGIDSALVTSPDGNSVAWCRRNSDLFRVQMRNGVRLVQQLMQQWQDLSRRYRDFDMAGIDVWRRIFAEHSRSE